MSTTFYLFVYLIHEIQDGEQIKTKNSVKLLRPKCFPIPLNVQVNPNRHGLGLLVHLGGRFSTNTYYFLGQQSNDMKKSLLLHLSLASPSPWPVSCICPQPACPLFTRESLEANPLLPPHSVSMLQKVRSHEWTINSNGSKSLGHLHPPIHITNCSVSIRIVLLSRLSLLWVLPEPHHERILSHSHWCHQVQPNSTLNNKKTVICTSYKPMFYLQ